MKKLIGLFSLALLVITSGQIYGEETEKKNRRPVSASIFTSEWLSSSNAWWEISDAGFNNASNYIQVRSRLDYDKTDSNVSMVGGKLTFINRFSINASYGSGKITNGRVTDSDWITSQADSLNNLKFSESKSDQ